MSTLGHILKIELTRPGPSIREVSLECWCFEDTLEEDERVRARKVEIELEQLSVMEVEKGQELQRPGESREQDFVF